ncbi:hypothetical protein SVXHr_2659 [Halorhabdus sp. SVX81]|nr:hypothetical protein SVXHr_2659 [Halorhabdus sp. SVX81]
MHFDYQSSLYRHRSKCTSLSEAIKANTGANDDTEDGGLSARPAGPRRTDQGTRSAGLSTDGERWRSLLWDSSVGSFWAGFGERSESTER